MLKMVKKLSAAFVVTVFYGLQIAVFFGRIMQSKKAEKLGLEDCPFLIPVQLCSVFVAHCQHLPDCPFSLELPNTLHKNTRPPANAWEEKGKKTLCPSREKWHSVIFNKMPNINNCTSYVQTDILAYEITHMTKGTLACKKPHRIPLNSVCLPAIKYLTEDKK